MRNFPKYFGLPSLEEPTLLDFVRAFTNNSARFDDATPNSRTAGDFVSWELKDLIPPSKGTNMV